MKTKKIVLVLAIALMGTLVMNAQPPRRHEMNKEQFVQERVERLGQQLNLTEEQKAAITRIYTEEMEAGMSKKHPGQMAKSEKPDEQAMKQWHQQMKAQREATEAKIEALLTPEQVTKYAELKREEGKRRHGRGHKGPRGGEKMPPQHEGGCNCPCKNN